jgi:DNA-directed RNA polymerase omega subunit
MKLKTMEEALKHYPNRFQLTMLAAVRAKELNRYMVDKMDHDNPNRMISGEEPLVQDIPGRKPVVVALREIAEGKVVDCEREEMDRIRDARRVVREKALKAAEPEEVEEGDGVEALRSAPTGKAEDAD